MLESGGFENFHLAYNESTPFFIEYARRPSLRCIFHIEYSQSCSYNTQMVQRHAVVYEVTNIHSQHVKATHNIAYFK